MTKTVKHTPGPWVAYHQSDHHEWQIGAGLPPDKADNDGHYELIVAETFGGLGRDDVQSDANARLIAAAPDLLEALKALRSACMGMVPDCADQVDAAIAKAEGEATND